LEDKQLTRFAAAAEGLEGGWLAKSCSSLADPFSQQFAQRAFHDPGGGRNVSDYHFLLSLPESLEIAPSA
jgi:hypothetical protein